MTLLITNSHPITKRETNKTIGTKYMGVLRNGKEISLTMWGSVPDPRGMENPYTIVTLRYPHVQNGGAYPRSLVMKYHTTIYIGQQALNDIDRRYHPN